jgi:hypothetical protein
MKKLTVLTFLSIAFISGMILMSSCTKEGPQGATGATGETGAAGEDGINGTDGTAGCVLCHDGGTDQGMFAQVNQWEVSVHAQGGNFERNYEDCATCHTSQGFLENLATGTGEVAIPISNPNPVNCYTCHNIHDTYTPADLGFTTSTAPTFLQGGGSFDIGKGNLCATCHQARTVSPMPVMDGADVTLTSYRFGGHHGPQANVLAGVGFMNFEGEGLGGNFHGEIITDGCVTCHMAEAYGVQAGGHTMRMNYEYHGSDAVSLAGCTSCHGETDDDQDTLHQEIEDLQEEVEILLGALKAALIAVDMYDDGSHGHAGYAVAGVQPANYAGAFLNYQMIEEDRSLGIHNPTFVVALLENTIAAITP